MLIAGFIFCVNCWHIDLCVWCHFRPLLKLVDCLMLVGVLTDEDVVKLLLGAVLLMLLSLHEQFLKILHCLCKIMSVNKVI